MSALENAFLEDLSFAVQDAAHGDLQTIKGVSNLIQALFNRLVTVKGSLAHRPTYGVGVKLWQNKISSIDSHRELAISIKEEFEKDERVEKVESVQIAADSEKIGCFFIKYKIIAIGLGQITGEFDPFGEI